MDQEDRTLKLTPKSLTADLSDLSKEAQFVLLTTAYLSEYNPENEVFESHVVLAINLLAQKYGSDDAALEFLFKERDKAAKAYRRTLH